MTFIIGKGWIDRILTAGNEKIRLKKLQRVGNSWALILPKVWVEFACDEDDEGRFWVEISDIDINKMTLKGHKR